MKAVRTMLTVGLALALLALTSCGADSRRASQQNVRERTQASTVPATGTGPIVPARVTDPARRAYIARVDAVCKRLDPERNGAREKAAGDTAQVLKGYDDSIGLGASQLRDIEAIKPPPGDAAALHANVFDVIRRQLAVRRQISTALANGDSAQVQTLQRQLDDLTRSLTGFARGYGFQVCGTD
jgi:hypothetical protein